MSTLTKLKPIISLICALLFSQFSFSQNALILNRRAILQTRTLDVTFPKWDHGHIIQLDVTRPAQVPKFYILDSNGGAEIERRLQINGASKIQLIDAALDSHGRTAVSGSASAPDGTPSAFIAWLDSSGKTERIVRTYPFTARHICFADGDELWAFGWELDANGLNEAAEYDALREYGQDGRQIRSLIPRSTLHSTRRPSSNSYLVSAHDRIGIYSQTANEWIEVNPRDGTVVKRWEGLANSGIRVRGVTLTDSGDAYAMAAVQGSTAIGRAYYRVERSSGTWEKLGVSDLGFLLGADGGDLIFKKDSEIRWIHLGR